MTITELKALKGEQLRIVVAEAEGWKRKTRKMYAGEKNAKGWELRNGDNWKFTTFPALLPDYDSNRDTITEAILRRLVNDYEVRKFALSLEMLVHPNDAPSISGWELTKRLATASAEDLGRAFLAAISSSSACPSQTDSEVR